MDQPNNVGSNSDSHISSDHGHDSGTVIIGAGIIGCATAYYLSLSGNTKPETIHLVETSPELFASASGKSGGFLASDWFGPQVASLGELSFKLHQQLADEYDGYNQWGYSRSTGTSLIAGTPTDGKRGEDWLFTGGSRAESAGVHEFSSDNTGPAWLTRQKGDRVELISADKGVAQVDPLRLSQFLLQQSLANGITLHHPAEAVSVFRDEATDTLSGLQIRHAADGTLQSLPCTRLLVTAGAWTPRVCTQLFPSLHGRIPISPLAGHSLVIRSPRWTREHATATGGGSNGSNGTDGVGSASAGASAGGAGCHAVFTTTATGLSPEIFSRVGGEIYVAGLNDAGIPLPARATDARIDAASIEELKEVSRRFLGREGVEGGNGDDLEVLREGLCFRPVTPRGTPILSRIPDGRLGGTATLPASRGGVYLAAGHGPWGISHSLGTGKVMGELVEGKPRLSADIGALGL